MQQIVLITGSARPNSANRAVVELVRQKLSTMKDISIQIADLAELALPFYDGETPPSAEGFIPTHESVKTWTDMIASSDGVVFVSPEYNHSLSAIQKNAIDWIYKEWTDKPSAFVGYGWYAARHVFAQFEEINTVIKTKLGTNMTGLQFGQDIENDGTPIDVEGVDKKLAITLNELMAQLSPSA